MSAVLYYSNYCNHCKQLLLKLSRTKTRDDLHFVCIDKREKHKDGTTHIILENGKRLLLPPNFASKGSKVLKRNPYSIHSVGAQNSLTQVCL